MKHIVIIVTLLVSVLTNEQDTTPFCKDLERAIELFANFKPDTPFYPNWGKEREEQILKTCSK